MSLASPYSYALEVRRPLSLVCDRPIDARPASPPPVPRAPRLLDQVRNAIQLRHYSRRTERAYVA